MTDGKIKDFIGKKKNLLIIIIGVVGIFLLFISEFTSVTSDNEKDKDSADGSCSEYTADAETRLCGLVSSVKGAGKTKVMLTFESDGTKTYAVDSKRSAVNGEKTTEISGEENYVLVDNGSGNDGLRLSSAAPEIRGVAVVCEGGGDPAVRREITETVSAALGVSRDRIYVAQMEMS